MSSIFAVVDDNGILAALLDREAARNLLERTVTDRNNAREDILGCFMESSEYYSAVGTNSYTRSGGDFLSLVTLTYINKSK